MSPVKRAFPLSVWLAVFALLLAAYLTGLWLLTEEAAPAVSLTGFSQLHHAGGLYSLLPGLNTALYATLLSLALGYPAGCILVLWKRRTIFISFLTPVFFLAGITLLYGGRLLPLIPAGFVSSVLSAANGYAASCQSIAIFLIPLTMLCACSFTKAFDSALASAARCLGASRFRAFLTFTFPRTLKGILAGVVTVFLPAAGIALVSDQTSGTAAGFVLPISAALLLMTAAAIAVCLLILKKARSVSPC